MPKHLWPSPPECRAEAIRLARTSGKPHAQIARELGIDRETVGRYLRLANPAISTPGSEEASEVKPAISTAGNGVGRKSQCEPLAEVISAKVEVGLSAQRIYQDLVEENGFTDSYQCVKRFVRKLRAARPERIWRMECQPGEELQLEWHDTQASGCLL